MSDNGHEAEIREMDARLQIVETGTEARLKAIQDRYVPISEDRLNKLWASVRETMNEFSVQLAEEQGHRAKQNEKIATLSALVEDLRQQVILLTAMQPTNNDGVVNDLALRLTRLEREHGFTDS